ncbi:MAG TPA: hypothetical protein VGH10_07020 [Actinomycetota bacterium]
MSDEPHDTEREIGDLRKELDEVKAELEQTKDAPRRRRRFRSVVAGTLVVVLILLFTVTVPAAWARRTFVDTNHYVATVGPLIESPAVQKAISRNITNSTFEALDVEQRIASALPEQLQVLAAPVTAAARNFLESQVQKLVASQGFENLWVQANQFAHAQVVAVLEGKKGVVSVVAGAVVLNMVPLVNQAMQQVQSFISNLVGRPVTLPTISANDVPSAAIEKLSAALGITLPSNFGQIVLFKSSQLKTAQQAFRFVNRLVILLIVLTIVLIPVTLWVSVHRRRTLIVMMTGFAVGLVVVRQVSRLVVSNQVATIRDPINRAAAQSVGDALVHDLRVYTSWLLVVSLIVLVIALVTGPYGWAVWLRSKITWLAREIAALFGEAVSGQVSEGPFGDWVKGHIGALQIGGAVVAVLVLLIFGPPWWGVLIIAGALVLYEVWLARLAARVRTPNGDPDAAGPTEQPV